MYILVKISQSEYLPSSSTIKNLIFWGYKDILFLNVTRDKLMETELFMLSILLLSMIGIGILTHVPAP